MSGQERIGALAAGPWIRHPVEGPGVTRQQPGGRVVVRGSLAATLRRGLGPGCQQLVDNRPVDALQLELPAKRVLPARTGAVA